ALRTLGLLRLWPQCVAVAASAEGIAAAIARRPREFVVTVVFVFTTEVGPNFAFAVQALKACFDFLGAFFIFRKFPIDFREHAIDAQPNFDVFSLHFDASSMGL